MKKLICVLSVFFCFLNFVNADDTVTYSDCVDGDTLKVMLDNKEYTVRLLAVDTPESVHPTKGVEYYGKEASEYTCNKIKSAKKIRLEYDDNSDKEDKYGRLLAWVFVDDVLLQEDLISGGYAKIAYLYDDYKYTSKLEKIQEEASANNIGIWNDTEKEKYNFSNNIVEDEETTDENKKYTKTDIIVIAVLLVLILFVGDKSIKKKAKSKLKKYLK